MPSRRRVPDALVLIFALIVLAQLASYVLPAGEFERDGRRVVPGTWRAVDAEPLPPLAFLTSIPAGLAAAQDIVFFVFIAGGVISVVRATGAIDALIGAAIGRLAGGLALDEREAAEGVLAIVNANMANAISSRTVQKGIDPRDFSLVAFGGAGPLHACDLADALGIPAALIPASPGVLSASGMLSSDVTRDAERGIHFPIPDVGRVDTDTLTATYRELRERARAAIAEDGYRSGVQIQYAADVRYQGQSHELTVGLASYRSARVIREALGSGLIDHVEFRYSWAIVTRKGAMKPIDEGLNPIGLVVLESTLTFPMP